MSETPKKKMKPLAWVGIGCGGVLLLAILVVVLVIGRCSKLVEENVGNLSDLKDNPGKFAAETFVKANPELTMLESNEAKGTITFRDKDGKEVTMSYEDLAEGRLELETRDGSTTTTTTIGSGGEGDIPEWFDLPKEITEWKSVMHMEQDGKSSGSVVGVSSLNLQSTASALASAMEAVGFAQGNKMESPDALTATYSNESEGKTLTLILTPGEEGRVSVQMSYQEK